MIIKFNFFATFVILMMFVGSCTEDDSSNTVTDIDGNVYHTLKIGTQTWMVENLKTSKFNDGTSIPYVTDDTAWINPTNIPGYCYFNNDIANKNIYGALYNWYAVNSDKLAPIGWHVPTNVEWTTLENYLIANGYNFDGTITDNKIAKSLADTSGWFNSTKTGVVGNDFKKNNTSGFTGLPSGCRDNYGTFGGIGLDAFWWASTEGITGGAWYRNLSWVHSYFYSDYFNKRCGFSVRCVRDY